MTRDAIIADMVDEIDAVGPEHVSTHCADPLTVDGVVDISPGSIGDAAAQKKFLQAAENNPRIDTDQLFGPRTIPKDKSLHLVITKATPQAAAPIPSINRTSSIFTPTSPTPGQAHAAPGVLILGRHAIDLHGGRRFDRHGELPPRPGERRHARERVAPRLSASTDRIQISFPYPNGINAGYKGTASIAVNVSGVAVGSYSAWIDFADIQTPTLLQRVAITVNVVADTGGGSGSGGSGYGWCSTCPTIVGG